MGSQNWLRSYLTEGISDDTSALDHHSIVMTNIGVLIAHATNLLILLGTPFLLGRIDWPISVVAVCAMIAYQAAHVLLTKKHYFAGRFVFSTALIFTISILSLIFGAKSGIHFLFFPVGIGALMIWPRQRKIQVFFAGTTFLLYLVFVLLALPGQLPVVELIRIDGFNIALINSALAFFVTFIVVLSLVIGSERLQNILENLRLHATEKAVLREDQMLATLNALALARDNETGDHILRTQFYVHSLATRLLSMGVFADKINEKFIDLLFKAAPLHDVGKIGVPDNILLKPEKLESEEWEVMKSHTIVGESVLLAASSNAQHSGADATEDVISIAINIAGGHHEHWDGQGYPRGLMGGVIPLEARIMAVADTYDALISSRVYKPEWSHAKAVEEIVAGSGTKFDPDVVQAFVLEQDRFNDIALRHKD